MGILNDLDSILGLICIIFAIYAHISPITLGFSLFGFFIADLYVSNQVLRDNIEVEAKSSQESLQKRPNRPNMDDPRQDMRFKAKHKTRRSESRRARPGRKHHGLTVVLAMARSWWWPRCGGRKCPCCFGFLRGLSFSHAIFRFVLRFCLEMRMY